MKERRGRLIFKNEGEGKDNERIVVIPEEKNEPARKAFAKSLW